jgi:hypothetical protein
LTLTTVLFVGSATTWAQGHDHSQAPTGRAPRAADSPLQAALRASDEAVRGLETALASHDAAGAAGWSDAYEEAVGALSEYLGEADPAGIASELARTDRALARQAKRLAEIEGQATGAVREPIRAARDAAERGRDALAAVSTEVHSTPPSRRRGC